MKASPYAAVLDRADAVRKNVERTGAGPEATTRVITHSALARRPHARYVAPFSARFAIAFFALMPLVRHRLGAPRDHGAPVEKPAPDRRDAGARRRWLTGGQHKRMISLSLQSSRAGEKPRLDP